MQSIPFNARSLMTAFAALSLAAILLGAYIGSLGDISPTLWIKNVLSWAVGAFAAVMIARTFPVSLMSLWLWAAPIGLAATMFSPDQQGVHRWIEAGPLHINIAMLLLPAAIVALASRIGHYPHEAISCTISLTLLVAQPDASQTTILSIATAMIAITEVRKPTLQAILILLCGAATILAWMQSDPLQPVIEVEEVLMLAKTISPALGFCAFVLLLAIAMAPAAFTLDTQGTALVTAQALSIALLLCATLPIFGAFPVPFLGIGPSPIIGSWIGIGLLAGIQRHQMLPRPLASHETA